MKVTFRSSSASGAPKNAFHASKAYDVNIVDYGVVLLKNLHLEAYARRQYTLPIVVLI
jgi:hypothetical protein